MARQAYYRQNENQVSAVSRDPTKGMQCEVLEHGPWGEAVLGGEGSESSIPASLRPTVVASGREDLDDDQPIPTKYLVHCPGCGAEHDGRRLARAERSLMRKALCSLCANADAGYELERDRYIRYQSRYAYDPDTPLSSYPDYPAPRSEQLRIEVAASDAARRKLRLSEAHFLCERHGLNTGLMLVHFPSGALFPVIPENRFFLDFIVGVDRRSMTWVVVALCVGWEAGRPTYCLDRDPTQAELAAVMNIWPQHLATELQHSEKPGWQRLRAARYRASTGSASQYYFPSRLVARALLGREIYDRLYVLYRAFEEH